MLKKYIPILVILCFVGLFLSNYIKSKYPNLLSGIGLGGQSTTSYNLPSENTLPTINLFRDAKQRCYEIANERGHLALFFEPNYCFIDYMNGDYQLVRP
jgi:hypothetical protein